jgi:hypothetical protein
VHLDLTSQGSICLVGCSSMAGCNSVHALLKSMRGIRPLIVVCVFVCGIREHDLKKFFLCCRIFFSLGLTFSVTQCWRGGDVMLRRGRL